MFYYLLKCIGLPEQTLGAEHHWLDDSHFGEHFGLHRIPSPEYPSGHGPHDMVGGERTKKLQFRVLLKTVNNTF